ncbi:MFS general substrate transporter [Ceraceosorus guamensis]|uniref:MFS general substrate transporter n=1 Tax=Ceraceosorus guamensis TaxID=1522189 RepID=A0A316VZB5_9BASI|nr:MFS general substrate transporter [Ceraceosorus guamensis]PWN41611.1 MFS general substrate transporter [Ceraceosorus guamensis]
MSDATITYPPQSVDAASYQPSPSAADRSTLDGTSEREGEGILGANDGEGQGIELAPVDGGVQAWTFVAAGAMYEMIAWGQSYSYGIFENYHKNDIRSPLYGKASPAATSAIGTLVIAGLHFAPFLLRGTFRTYPHLVKTSAIVATVLSAASLLVASFVPSNVGALLFLQGIFYGLTGGVGFALVVLWIPQWFDERMGTANGIIFSGSGLGGTIFPLVLNKLLQRVGFAWTLRVMSLYSLILAGGSILLLKPRLPVRRPTALPRNPLRRLAPEGVKELWSPLALAQEAAVIFQTVAWCTISLYISSYTTSLGFSTTTATGVLSAFNAAATVGFFLVGRLVDGSSHTVLMAISTLVCSVLAFVFLGFTRSLPLLIVFALLFGTAGGGFTTFLGPISKTVALRGNQEIAAIHSATIFIRGVAAVLGPLLGSTLYNEHSSTFAVYGTNGFRGVVLYVGSSMTLAGGCSIAANWLGKRATSPSS